MYNGTYFSEWYDNQPDQDSAADIVVSAPGTISGIDAALESGGHITGTVTGPDGTTPLQNIEVIVLQWNASYFMWDQINDAYTDSSGNFDIGGLSSGTYRVAFWDGNGIYAGECYDNQADLDTASDIMVNAPRHHFRHQCRIGPGRSHHRYGDWDRTIQRPFSISASMSISGMRPIPGGSIIAMQKPMPLEIMILAVFLPEPIGLGFRIGTGPT
jgi:hypothetical protein